MQNVFVQRSPHHLTLVTRVVGLVCVCIFGGLVLFAQPTTSLAVNLGAWTAVATSSASDNDDGWTGVTYGNGRFVAVGTGTDRVMYSDDGLTWTVTTPLNEEVADSWTDVTFGNGEFIAVGDAGQRLMYSFDGIDWYKGSAAANDDAWQSVVYADFSLVAVGNGPDRVMRGSSGVSFTSQSALGDDDSWIDVTYGNSRFVAIADDVGSTDYVMHSVDGFSWEATSLPAEMNDMVSVSYGNNRFIIVTQSGAIYQSPDGILWSLATTFSNHTILQSFFANGLFIVMAENASSTPAVFVSPDGLTWSNATPAINPDTNITDITYGEGRFVAVSNAGDRVVTATSDLWTLTQTGFQFRNDNGSETTATSIKGQNSTLEFPANVAVRLRTQIDSQLATTTTPYYLQYKNTGSETDWHTVGVDDSFPYVRSSWSSYTFSSVTTHDLQQPQCLVGDLNLVIFSHDGVETSRSTSTGWVKLGEQSNGVAVTGAIYYKFADGNDNLVVTTTAAEAASFVSYCIGGAGTPTATAANGNSTNSDAPLHRTDAVRDHLFLVTRSGDDVTAATAAPTGYGQFLSQPHFSAAGAATDVAIQYLRASSTNPGVFTSATEQWVSWTIAIPPRQTPTVGTLEAAIDNTPATSTNNGGYGSIAWTNPGRATTSDESRASVTVSSTTASNYLNVTEWGFAIPSNATIVGITASVEKTQSGGTVGVVRDNSIRLIKGGTVVGNNYASTTEDWQTTEYVSTYGTSSDLWGTTWTPTDINASNFGIALSVQGSSTGANRIANIDHVVINVYYTVPSPFRLALSPNIAATGASTTARMIAPTIHVKADFTGGHITEDQTPTPAVTIAESSYTELEWSIVATGTASTTDNYEFRTSIGLDAPVESIAGNIIFTIAPTTTIAFITFSGTAYSDVGSTTVPAGQEIVLALGEANPVLYATTTTSGGAFTINVATSTESVFVPASVEKSNDTIVAVAHGKGQYVAITAGDSVLTSKNGFKWRKKFTFLYTIEWKDVVYGKGVFVAVGTGSGEGGGNPIAYSTNGIEWVEVYDESGLGGASYTSVAYGKGRFVAVGDSGARVAYSSDGINWTYVTSGVAGDDDFWSSVTYGNKQFTAVAEFGNTRVMTSPDGITWTARSAAGDDDNWTSLTYGNGRFVATGNGGNNRAMYSSDGISWTAASAAGDDDGWKSVKYGNGRYLAVGKGGNNRAMSSLDGIIWSILTTKRNNHNWNKVTYGNGKFIIAGDPVGGESVTTLDPGIGPDTAVLVYRKATSSRGSTFVAGLDGLSALSGIPLYGDTMLVYNATTSATTSVTDLGELAFYDSTNDSNIVYNASSTASTTIFADLITATGTTKASDPLVLGGDFTQNGLFDSDGGILEFAGVDPIVTGSLSTTSPLSSLSSSPLSGGQAWLPVSAAGNNDQWNAITYGNGLFVAVACGGDGGCGSAGDRVMTSPNGLTWTAVATSSAAGNNDSWVAVTYGNGRFVAVGDSGDRVMTSTDGLTWATTSAAGNDDFWGSIAYGNGRFVAVGGSGDRVMTSTDGLTWATTSAAGNDDFWGSIAYGNGRFVAVGGSGDRVMTSTDGLTWATTSAAGNNDQWEAITYGNGRFVAVGGFGGTDSGMTSTDGLTWATTSVVVIGDYLQSVTYGGGRFVAVGFTGERIMTSTDGLTWATTSAVGNDDGWFSVTYANGRFVAVGISGDRVMTSLGTLSINTTLTAINDISVTSNTVLLAPTTTLTIGGNVTQFGYFYPRGGTTTLTGTNNTFTGDFYAPTLLDLADTSGQLVIDGVYYSGDFSSTVYSLTVNPGADFSAPYGTLTVYGNYNIQGTTTPAATTTFVGIAPRLTGKAEGVAFDVLESSPQLGFNVVTAAGNNDQWNDVTYGNGRFVAVSQSGDRVMTSADGLTWATTSAAGNNDSWNAVTYGNSRFVAVSQSGDRVMTSADGLTWATTSAAGNNDSWKSVTYGNGRFVAVGITVDRVMTSTDGLTWTAVATSSAAGNNDSWQDVTYGNGRFVAVGTGGDRVMTSPDGLTWTAVATSSAAGNDDSWDSVTYGNGRFVAVGYGGDRVMHSTDGLTWTAVATSSAVGNNDSWFDVTYGNGRFVAVGSGLSGDNVMISLNGLTWATTSAVGNNDTWYAVTYGNGRFMVVGYLGDRVMSALGDGPDLRIDTPVTLTGSLIIDNETSLLAPTSTLSIAGNFENRGTFVPRAGTTTLSGVGTTITGNLTSINETTNSPDYGLTNITGTYTYIGNGTTSALTIDAGGELTAPAGGTLAVAHNFTNNGTFINNGATTTFSGNLSGTTTGTSTLGNTIINARSQGLEWLAIATSSAAGNNDFWYDVTYGNGRFVAVSANTDRIMTSTDGLNWTAVATSSAAGNDDTWRSVTYGNGRFVAVGTAGDRVMTSTDGLTWATTSAAGNDDSWQAITYGNGRFVAVGTSAVDNVMTSTDGLTWATTSSTGNADDWNDITFGNGRFVAVTYFGTNLVMTSTDGLTWATTSAAGDGNWWSVTYGNGRFVAVSYGATDRVMTSTDGLTWATTSAAGDDDSWRAVTYGNGLFVALGSSGDRVMTSTDGLTWATTSAAGNDEFWRGVTYGNGRFVAVGSSGSDRVMTSVGTSLFTSNVSTINLTINASSTVNASGTVVSVAGNYTNSGTLTASTSTFIFDGTSTQVATGTMNGSSTFNNLTITNTSGNGTTTQSVQFGAPVSATGTMTMLASTSAQFVASSTNTFNNVTWEGTNASRVWLRSSIPGTQWNLDIDGVQSVEYVNVRDSNATTTTGGVTNIGGVDSGNNINWNFTGGAPLEWNSSDWTLFDTLTIDAANIDANLTDFPVYVNLDDLSSAFWSTTPTGSSTVGTDIRVTTADDVEVPRELVFASSTTQTGELYFKAPSISSTTDTVFKIWYNGNTAGDYATTSTYGAQNVWTNDFVLVYHLQQDPSGGTGAVRDSTRFNHNGTGGAAMTSSDLITGKLGRGYDFDGTINDGITSATSTRLANLSPLTACTWYEHDTYPGPYANLLDKSTDGQNSWNVWAASTDDFGFLKRTGGYIETSSVSTSWQYVCATDNGAGGATGIAIYKNGIDAGGSIAGFGAGSDDTNVPLHIGGGAVDFYLDGRMDEVRVASTTRTAAWIAAEYANQATSTDFYTTESSVVPRLVLSNHPLGQVNNTFSGSAESDEPLFGFTLTPEIESASTTVTLTLSNTVGLDSSNLSDWRLYRDTNSDQLLDGGDVQVGGAGTFSTTSVIFGTPFLATTSQSYIVTADLSGIETGDRVTISLTSATIMATSTQTGLLLPEVGTISSTNHLRSKKAGGGGSVNFINIGAPGNGIVGGGSNEGGEELGGQPNFNPPASNGSPHNEWTTGGSGYLSDGSYTTETTAGQRQSYGTYGFSIPTNNQITGIEVKLEASASTPAGTIEVALSWDNGTSITTVKSTATLTATDTIYTLGSPSDLWGRAWVPSEFSNGLFGLRIIGQPSGGNTVQVDAMQVRVYHQATGGGAGGGGGEL